MLFLFFHLTTATLKNVVSVKAGSLDTEVSVFEYQIRDNFPQINLISSVISPIKLADADTDNNIIPEFVQMIKSFVKLTLKDTQNLLIYIYGTGGMRKLGIASQRLIMSRLRVQLRSSTDFFIEDSNIQVIDGPKESYLWWISANYQRNQLQKPFTVGVLDISATDLDISYDTSPDYQEYLYESFQIKDNRFNVYSNSYQNLGTINVMKKIEENLTYTDPQNIINPCLNNGFEITDRDKRYKGVMDFDKCDELVRNIVVPAIHNTTRPKLQTTTDIIYGFGGFTLFNRIADLAPGANLISIRSQSKAICQETSDQIKSKTNNSKYAHTFCLQGILSYNIMSRGLMFPDNVAFMQTDQISGRKVSLTAGMVIDPLLPKNQHKESSVIVIVSIVLSCVVALCIIIVAIYCIQRKRRWLNGDMSEVLNSKSLLGSY